MGVGPRHSAVGQVSKLLSAKSHFQGMNVQIFDPAKSNFQGMNEIVKGKRAPFSSWAGKRSGEMPIYHEVPEYARC